MNAVRIAPSALKHGISAAEAVAAWENFACKQRRSDDAWIAIGFSASGKEIELVALDLLDGDVLIVHAMSPSTEKMRRELGMGR